MASLLLVAGPAVAGEGRTAKASAGEHSVLLRAVGPTLTLFDIAAPLRDPRITVFSGQTPREENEDWGQATNAAVIATTAHTLGGFPLIDGDRDAALLPTLAPGNYTAHIRGAANDSGLVLVELYNVEPRDTRLLNLSARAVAGTGDDLLIAGFALSGTGARTLLIRAVGPTLAELDVPNVMADPVLTLFEGDTPILSNDDWANVPSEVDVLAASEAVGAFPLPPGSRDAVLLVTLMPGSYTAQVRGAGGTTGDVLVEVYAVP